MIKLKSLQLNNFLSHNNTFIEFKDEQKLLVDGKSGHGKSAIVDAVVWVLYGKGRSDNKSLIRHGNDNASVELVIEDTKESKFYKVERKISSKNKHEILLSESVDNVNFSIIKTLGIRESQEFIELVILKSSYQLFINSVIYPQDNIDTFIKQPSSKRKDMILEMINAKNFDEYLDKTKNLLKEKKITGDLLHKQLDDKKLRKQTLKETADRLEEYSNKKSLLNSKIEEIEAEYESLVSKKSQLEIKYNEIDLKKKSEQELINNINNKSNRINELNIKLSALKSESNLNIDTDKLKENKEKIANYFSEREKLIEWTTARNEFMKTSPIDLGYDDQIKRINEELINLLNSETPTCPKCGFELDENKNNNIESLNSQLLISKDRKIKYEKELDDFKVKLSSLDLTKPIVSLSQSDKELIEQEINNAENLQQKESSFQSELSSNETELKLLENEIKDINLKLIKLREEIESCNGSDILQQAKEVISMIDGIKVKKYNLSSELSDVMRLYSIATASKDELNKVDEEIVIDTATVEKINTDIDSLELVKNALGNNGIKAILIDYIIPQLEDKINYVLSQLSDFKIKIETQKSGSGKDVVLEGLFLNIINELGEVSDFCNYSGGEKIKIMCSITEGLASFQKCGFRILDELVQGLDSETEEKFSNTILSLKNNISQLIAISHIQGIKDIFEEKILIEKTNGVSKIIN